jgi:hypothetical protein
MLRIARYVSSAVVFWFVSGMVLAAVPAEAQVSSEVRQLLQGYCIGCHNERAQAGGVMLDRIDTADVRVDAEVWERILRRLRSRTMPVPGRSPRPDNAMYEAAIADIQTRLDKLTVPLKPSARITATELASRMADLLWGNPPDTFLTEAARRGELGTNAGIEKQVIRMIADPQSRKFEADFIAKWLHLDWIEHIPIEPEKFAEFPGSISMDMQREVTLFIDSQFRQDRPVTELFTANYTFMNGSLARIYEVPSVTSPQFVRMNFPDDRRAGLLGMAGVLAMGSVTIRTSATLRAKWLWQVFFGAPPPAPPPNLPPLVTFKTHRQLEAAYSEGPCRSCHFISQLAGPLENFDELGRWRTLEMGEPVDASGMLPDGTLVNGPVELRNGLMKFTDAFTMTLSERVMAYALGRGANGRPVYWQEMPAVRAAARHAAAKDQRWSAVLAGIIESDAFQARKRLP